MNLYPLGKALTYALVRILFKVNYEGLENIPEGEGFILASNHRSNFDPLFIAHRVRAQVHYMAKIELFRNRFIGWILRSVGAFPIDRGSGDSSAMDIAGGLVRDGHILGMFPEGHRAKDGKPQRARSGLGMVAAQTGANILPCAVVYGERLGFRTHVTVRYGKLLTNSELALDTAAPSAVRKASKRVMEDIVALMAPDASAPALPEREGA